MLWVLVAVVAIYVLFIRKKTALVIGATQTAAYPLQTPKAAIPQPTTGQVLGAAAIKSAPQIISALGSFFDDSNDVDTSGDDFVG